MEQVRRESERDGAENRKGKKAVRMREGEITVKGRIVRLKKKKKDSLRKENLCL